MAKRLILFPYCLIRWVILIGLLVSLTILVVVEHPAIALGAAKNTLAEQNITYGSIRGGLLSGFELSDLNYQDQLKVQELHLKMDIAQLRRRLLYIDDMTLKGVEVEESFLASLIDSNSSEESNQSESNLTLPFDRVQINHANVQLGDIHYQSYHLHKADLIINDLHTDMRQHYRGDITLQLNSNMGEVDLKSKINDTQFQISGHIRGEHLFLNPLLTEQLIILSQNPQIDLQAEGDMNGTIQYDLLAKDIALDYNRSYQARSEEIKLTGTYDLPKEDLNAHLITTIDSNVAEIDLDAQTALNLSDINQTLTFDIDSELTAQKSWLNPLLREQNLTVTQIPPIRFKTEGSLKQADFTLKLNALKAKQNQLDIGIKTVALKGASSILTGTTSIDLNSTLGSSAGEGRIATHTALNFNDPQKTLQFDAEATLQPLVNYLNEQLKGSEITISGSPQVKLSAQGDMNRITAQASADTQLSRETIQSHLNLKTTPITVNLQHHTVQGELKLISDSRQLQFDLNSQFNGNYTNPQALQSDTTMDIRNFNALGINLASIAPLKVKLQSSTKGATATIDSQRLRLTAQTPDYDQLTFNIQTGNLYLSKIMELPPQFEHKFIKLDLQGNATLSKKYLTLQGDIESNKQFKAQLDVHNNSQGLNAQLTANQLTATVTGNIDQQNLDATIQTPSLKALQTELLKLYPFKLVEVDGSLVAKASLRGEAVKASVDTPKLAFEGFNIEQLALDADYHDQLLLLNTLSFQTTGFKDKKLNQAFYLNQKGIVHLGESRDILIDIYPNILIQATGDSNNITGLFKIDKLPLGHPKYGAGLLTTNIHYKQSGLDRYITGDINLDQLKLYYEAKFLDANYDPDVIIITKADKKNPVSESDIFLNHTAIDLNINAKSAKYKTADVKLDFDVDLEAKKSMGHDLALLGRIEEIEGYVDQVPKRFTVKESNIVFQGGKTINPLLDLHVEYELPQVLIYITIGGTASRPKLEFTSDPSLPKKDILSYLLFGVSTANLTEREGGSLSREAELFIINQAARDFAYDFDLDRIFIKDDGTGEGYAIEAGKNITPSNMFIIETSKVGNSFILEHDISKNIQIRAGQHQKEQPSQSIDLFFRKKFK